VGILILVVVVGTVAFDCKEPTTTVSLTVVVELLSCCSTSGSDVVFDVIFAVGDDVTGCAVDPLTVLVVTVAVVGCELELAVS